MPVLMLAACSAPGCAEAEKSLLTYSDVKHFSLNRIDRTVC